MTPADLVRVTGLTSPSAINQRFRMRSLSQSDIFLAISDIEWQRLRSSLHNVPILQRLDLLESFLHRRPDTIAHVCVINYINALRRAGMLPS